MKVKFFLLLNVFFSLTIFAWANGSFPFIIECTGALELLQIHRMDNNQILLGGTFTNTLSYENQNLVSKGEEDVFLMSLGPEGQLRWLKSFGGIFDDDLSCLFVENETIWLAGGFRDRAFFDTLDLSSPDGSRSLFLLELNNLGQILSNKQLDSPGLKSITGITKNKDGDVIIGGYFRGQLVFDDESLNAAGRTDGMVLKLDRGDEWSVVFQAGLSGNSRIEHLVYDSTQNLIIGGTFDDQLLLGGDTLTANTLDKDVFIASLNTDGQVQWSLKAGGVFDKELVRLAVDTIGNIYGAGQLVGVMKLSDNLNIQSRNGNTDVYWFQLNSSGQPVKAETVGGTDAEVLTDLLIHDSSLWLCGNFQGSFMAGDQLLEAGLTVSSFLIELNLESKAVRSVESLSASVASFIYRLSPLGPSSVLAGGSFGGQLEIGGGNSNSGGSFWGFLTAFGPLSTRVEEAPLLNMRFFPNPFRDQLFFESPQEIKQIWVFDSMGRLRWQNNGPASALSFPMLEKGIYQIMIKARNGQIGREWVVKQ